VNARHVLFTRLSGLPFTRAPFPRSRNDHNFKNGLAAFITCLTPELAAELTHAAEEFLIRHQIRDEPPAWQPPAKLLDGLDLPGPDFASKLNEIHELARADGASAAAIARHLGTTSDAIQALLLDHPAPADPAGGARRRRARYDISREQLRDLHHGQRLSFTEIGQRTGYSRTAINDLARTYGIPVSVYRESNSSRHPPTSKAEDRAEGTYGIGTAQHS
jgi:biotin operon repressor